MSSLMGKLFLKCNIVLHEHISLDIQTSTLRRDIGLPNLRDKLRKYCCFIGPEESRHNPSPPLLSNLVAQYQNTNPLYL